MGKNGIILAKLKNLMRKKVFFQMTLLDRVKIGRDACIPKKSKRQLDRYVVGQEQAKELLAVASYNHYKRINLNDPDIQKSNILLMGQTGCGKTHLVRTLARILDVPVTIVPATRLTEAGYFGDDVESCIQSLLMEAGNDVEKAESGIVFIDEIDKLTSSSTETQRVVGGKRGSTGVAPSY